MNKIKLFVVISVFVLVTAACAPLDWVAEQLGYHRPVSNDGLIVQIDGSGSQGAYGDSFNGRKIVVRDDLEPNDNGWYDREVYEVSSLEELGISDAFQAEFVVEYERDFSQARGEYVPYFSMNISPQIDEAEILAFAEANPSVIVTSVVNRVDPNGKMQECSLSGLQPDAVRYVLYEGDGVTYQICDSNLTVP